MNSAFLALEVTAVWRLAPAGARISALGCAVVLPFLLWNYLMGFAIYCHHTHPSVKWYDVRSEWNFYEAQVCSTTHTRFPGGAGWLLHNIFEHTAHHVDTGIPFYRLCPAQTKMEELCGDGAVQSETFSPRAFLTQMRTCQLYDYRRHRWLQFRDAENAG